MPKVKGYQNDFKNSPQPVRAQAHQQEEEDPNETRLTGMITKLVADKGFGFIVDKSGGEHFFHRSGIRAQWESLQVRQKVSFVTRQGPKGMRAEHIDLEEG